MIECVLIQWLNPEKTNFVVLNMNAQLLSPVVEGLDPNLEYLVKRIPYEQPIYDTRLASLVITQSVGGFDSEYPSLRQWVTTYTLQQRTIDEKIVSIDEAENNANFSAFTTNYQFKLMCLAISIVDRKASGLTISTTQKTILDLFNAKSLKIWQNHITGQQKKADLQNNLTIDLDSGWVNE